MVLQTPTSNPLPPPPPRRRNDGSASAMRQENLSNADFRRMVMETPRRVPDDSKAKKKTDESAKRAPRKYRPPKPKDPSEETSLENLDLPRYRDRARERREDQNPDYEVMQATGISSLQAVPPPGAVDLQAADLQKISIANSKYLGGDVEHTHLVKGLDYALLNKVRSEIVKDPEDEEFEEPEEIRPVKEDEPLTFHTAAAKVVHRWIVKPPSSNKINEMFLPGRMAFLFDTEEIPTTVYRSKDDCPPPEEYVAVGVDAAVSDRIAKIMQYLKLGSSGKVLKKKKKEKGDVKVKVPLPPIDEDKPVEKEDLDDEKEDIKPETREENPVAEEPEPPKPRATDDDIFQDAGIDYVVTVTTNGDRSPEDMEESPRDGQSYFQELQEAQDWQQYGPVQGPTMPQQFPVDWQDHPAAQYPYPEQYFSTDHVPDPSSDLVPQSTSAAALLKDPRFLSQEEKDRGMSSVFKRDDQTLRQRRELDAREKDPNFVSDSYSECYPGYQEYNREVVDSDDEDMTKMDMGGKAKGRLHRWDFETEEDWAKYNDQKEAMPKAAYQFGVKMQDGRKTKKQNKDQKLNNELHKITQIMEKKKKEKGEEDGGGGGSSFNEEDNHPSKRVRV